MSDSCSQTHKCPFIKYLFMEIEDVTYDLGEAFIFTSNKATSVDWKELGDSD